jgi:hypothetical protein
MIFVGSERLIAEADGTLHLVYRPQRYQPEGTGFTYAKATPNGTWGAEMQIESGQNGMDEPNLVQSTDKTLHFCFKGNGRLLCTSLKPGGDWKALSMEGYVRSIKGLFADGANGVTVLYEYDGKMARYRSGQGDWSAPVALPIEGETYVYGYWYWDAALDSNDVLQLFNTRPDGIFTAHTRFAPQTASAAFVQSISVPADMSHPTLSFLSQMSSAHGVFTVRILQGEESNPLFTSAFEDSGWRHHWFDLSAYAGQTISLDFRFEQAANRPYAAVYLDEVSLGSSYPDLWVSLAADCAMTAVSSPVTYQLRYGNHGGVSSPGSTLKLTLPAGVVFDHASIPPTAVNGQVLSWDTGALPAGGGPHSILVYVHTTPSVPGHSTITASAAMQASVFELSTINNSAQAHVFIGSTIYLPLLRR